MVTARGDQLIENYGFDIYALAKKEAIGWVAAQTQISYLYPAFIAEEVLIQTRLIGFGPGSLLLEAIMWNSDKSIVKALMWTKLVHFDLAARKSKEHSPSLMEFFEKIVNPLPVETAFDSRVKTLKTIQ